MYRFIDGNGTFTMTNATHTTGLYLPIANETGLKSAFTPDLGGDCKIDQNTFLLPPVSIEDLHNNRATRNFWCAFGDGTAWSATGVSAEEEARRFSPEEAESTLTAGLMWQETTRESKRRGLRATITAFSPVQRNVEALSVTLRNIGEKEIEFTPIAAIPLYGRSADNLRDHRHVTSLLHRIRTTKSGVLVRPTLSFDERGHVENRKTYFVCGVTGNGETPEGTYPTVESFLGEGGTYLRPRTVYEDFAAQPPGSTVDGREAMGALCFSRCTLAPNQEATYLIFLGVTEDETEIEETVSFLGTRERFDAELSRTKSYWLKRTNVTVRTGDIRFDGLMRWVSFQPILRRLYGCSFLPHHDYGRGGRGWRDLWQDCLALLLMEPAPVGEMLKNHFRGVRIDGTNATIIGDAPGEFKADRNGIMRVWMDHGFWPYLTTRLYLDETGDLSLLLEKVPYFYDAQVLRGTKRIEDFAQEDTLLHDRSGAVYEGTILEHLLVQNLSAVCERGEHGELLLRGADWNDALDMATHRGESVAFTAAYTGNLLGLAETLEKLSEAMGEETVEILTELSLLLEEEKPPIERLDAYIHAVERGVSGKRDALSVPKLAESLRRLANEMQEHIRGNEWVGDGAGNGWFNSYYDDNGRKVEGLPGIEDDGNVRMMLTGQVFTILSGTANAQQVDQIIAAADRYLFDGRIGGYRLNTDFHEIKKDMGRMFGFAYGEKENGAVFSHMAVMYAYALYARGKSAAGEKVLRTLSDHALDFASAKIYPGIPEYFRADGRGMYHYLTGAGSWYLLTILTQTFGVRGDFGDLVIAPTVSSGSIEFSFAGRTFSVTIEGEAKEPFTMKRAEIERTAPNQVIALTIGG